MNAMFNTSILSVPKSKSFFFIGVSGIGMSAIASIIQKTGYRVGGSSNSGSKTTENLRKQGIEIFTEHNSQNIREYEIIVYSTAIKEDNQEIKEAKKTNKMLIHRSEALAMIANAHKTIAVTGTHGKTTVTSLISTCLDKADKQITAAVGGIVKDFCSNHKFTVNSEYFVTEADESDKSLLNIQFDLGIITNIELDHVENYKNGIEEVIETYIKFCTENCKHKGTLLLCIDDNITREKLLPKLLRHTENKEINIITYGVSKIAKENAEYYLLDENNNNSQNFIAVEKETNTEIDIQSSLHGMHNVTNVLVAIATMRNLNIDIQTIKRTISEFNGIDRRLEKLMSIENGIISFQNKIYTATNSIQNIIIIDDYAHHPTEIAATIKAAKEMIQNKYKRLVCIFQPHKYTRFNAFFNEFITEFSSNLQTKDQLYITEVYAAGEKPEAEYKTVSDMKKQLTNLGVNVYPETIFIKNGTITPDIITQNKKDGDCWLIMSAGDLSSAIRKTCETIWQDTKKSNTTEHK